MQVPIRAVAGVLWIDLTVASLDKRLHSAQCALTHTAQCTLDPQSPNILILHTVLTVLTCTI